MSLEKGRLAATTPATAPTPTPPTSGDVADPAQLSLTAAAIDVPVTPVNRAAGPALPRELLGSDVAWFDGTNRPGEAGVSVLAGHVVWDDAPGVFAALEDAAPASRVTVTDSAGAVHDFTIVGQTVVPKARLDPALLAFTPERRVLLVTCAGPVDPSRRLRSHNLIVLTVAATPPGRRQHLKPAPGQASLKLLCHGAEPAGLLEVGEREWVELAGDVALEAAHPPTSRFVQLLTAIRTRTRGLWAGTRAHLEMPVAGPCDTCFMLEVPQNEDLMWLTLEALRHLGGSGTIQEIAAEVVSTCGFTEDLQRIPHGEGRQSELDYRLAWARTYLKAVGAITNSARGVRALTDPGERMTEVEVIDARKAWKSSIEDRRRQRRQAAQAADVVELDDENQDDQLEDWKDQLIFRLLGLSAGGFERLAQRLLREAGFTNVTVRGKSGDGGIDGIGTYRLSLVSFPTFFQCKRYKGAVPVGAVRDFRGAMVGRGEKGLLITTGAFTREATLEATRDGAPPIELIEGDRLCDLLKTYSLGIEVSQRVVEDVTVTDAFFEDLS